MTKQQKGLGRGFEGLLPQNFDTDIIQTEERVKNVLITDLKPNPEQPRTHFDEGALDGLAESIKQHGIVQPLVVTPTDKGYYIIAGERRWRAAKKAGLKSVPAIVRTAEQLERLEIALVENVQRVDLSPLEQAASIQWLHEQFSMDFATIAQRLGKASTTVHNIARLLQLPKSIQQALAEQKISEGHARSILALKTEPEQVEFLALILKNDWSVRQAERYVTVKKQGIKRGANAASKVATTSPQTEKLGSFLKAPVTLKHLAKGGKLEIAFRNETDLKRIMRRIQS